MKTKLLSLIILFVSTLVMGQDSTLVGSVVDSNTDGPLPGVSVVIKGTQSGTTTDFDGNFSLSGVESGDVIQFSYIGYVTQEIEICVQSWVRGSLNAFTSICMRMVPPFFA